MQQAPQQIFDLTPLERRVFSGASRWKAPVQRRIHAATYGILQTLTAVIPPVSERRVDYHTALTIPEFNGWVDKQVELQHAAIRAQREAAALKATELLGVTEADANGEVLH